jgi:hypothetical protein
MRWTRPTNLAYVKKRSSRKSHSPEDMPYHEFKCDAVLSGRRKHWSGTTMISTSEKVLAYNIYGPQNESNLLPPSGHTSFVLMMETRRRAKWSAVGVTNIFASLFVPRPFPPSIATPECCRNATSMPTNTLCSFLMTKD